MSQERQPVGEFAVLQVKHELSHGKHVVPVKTNDPVQELQLVAEVEQVAQGELHELQVGGDPAKTKDPDPQVMQVELGLRTKGDVQLVQVVEAPEHVAQLGLQG